MEHQFISLSFLSKNWIKLPQKGLQLLQNGKQNGQSMFLEVFGNLLNAFHSNILKINKFSRQQSNCQNINGAHSICTLHTCNINIQLNFDFFFPLAWLILRKMDTNFETLPDEQLAELLREFSLQLEASMERDTVSLAR